jgi:hypothetical protein
MDRLWCSDTGGDDQGHIDGLLPRAWRRSSAWRFKVAVLLAGACVAVVPSQVWLEPTPAGPVALRAPASPDASPRLSGTATRERPLPPVAEPGFMDELSELAPAEAVMILPLPVPQGTSEIAAGSPMAPAAQGPGTVLVGQDTRLTPSTIVEAALLPPRLDEMAAWHQVAAPELQRAVDIEQIADSEARTLRTAQITEPALAAGGAMTLAMRADAMQVTLPPPPRLRDEERAALMAESPSHVLVRIGDSALGNVALRTSDTHGFDVQLSGLLDLLTDRFDSGEFERLRASAAAGTFVSFDHLRAIGLNLRYDPIYDELRITG